MKAVRGPLTSFERIKKRIREILIDFDKLFQKIGAVWLNELYDILREDAKGRSRVR